MRENRSRGSTIFKHVMKALRKFRHPVCVVSVSLVLAIAIWLPCVHWLFIPKDTEIYSVTNVPLKAVALARRHTKLWSDPVLREQVLNNMRRSNAEWDFMGRTFLVLSLCEMSLRQPSLAKEYLPICDTIIAETIRLEQTEGMYFFLMPYAKAKPFVAQPARSLFIESEIALMLAARRMVAEKPEYKTDFGQRIEAIVERLEASPYKVMESYPDECWLFDHSMALAAIRLGDHLDGSDHRAFLQEWVKLAKLTLTDRQTGLLISSFGARRQRMDGPEGSSIWLSLHCLRLVDEGFAREQYQLAKQYLSRSLCGFAWSREWPAEARGPQDIDSGTVIPLLDVSPGGSGLAFIAAASFDDKEYFKRLHTTVDFAGFPTMENAALRYCASNQVGDAVMLYSLVLGPMWERVMKGTK